MVHFVETDECSCSEPEFQSPGFRVQYKMKVFGRVSGRVIYTARNQKPGIFAQYKRASKKTKYSVSGLRSTILPIFWSECVLLVLALPEPVGGRAFGPRPPSKS